MTNIDIESRIWESQAATPTAATAPAAAPTAGPSFSQILQGQLTDSQSQFQAQAARAGIKFSGHAQTRLNSRQIPLSGDDIARLGDAITKAAAKGARESLVLVNQAALVVSVPNRTVITAVDKNSLKENIFTNIDSAVFL